MVYLEGEELWLRVDGEVLVVANGLLMKLESYTWPALLLMRGSKVEHASAFAILLLRFDGEDTRVYLRTILCMQI